MNQSEMREKFAGRFGKPCIVVARAPGRVNLIGEHTDYNDGFVLPIATEQDTWVAVAPRDDGRVRTLSAEFDDDQTWVLDAWQPEALPHWTSYVAGVAALLAKSGVPLTGFDAVVCSTVPPGGGLSSSAALETATGLALTTLAGKRLTEHELIDLCRQAEHEFAGVPCGLMDQSVSTCAQAGHAFLLDCRSRAVEHIPCRLDGLLFLVIDSGVRHKLAAGEYAKRQQECNRAVDFYKALDPGVRALRDVTLDTVGAHADELDSLATRRARHVVSENARTQAAGDVDEFGRLMSQSHASLRDDYEVSCAELDQLVEIVSAVEGVRGARMTGGGFGGCVVALTSEDAVADIEQAIGRNYTAGPVEKTRLVRTRPSRGASVEFG